MVVLAGRSTDHLRVSSKRRYQSSRLDIPVPALNELEDLKLLLDRDLPSSFQGEVKNGKYLTDAQSGLFQVETQSSKHEQLKGYVEFISAGDNLFDKFELDSRSMAKTLRFAPVAIRNFLRWSFNDIIHACVQLNNCQLAEQLFVEVINIYGFVGYAVFVLNFTLSISLISLNF